MNFIPTGETPSLTREQMKQITLAREREMGIPPRPKPLDRAAMRGLGEDEKIEVETAYYDAVNAWEEEAVEAEAKYWQSKLPVWDNHIGWLLEYITHIVETEWGWLGWHIYRAAARGIPVEGRALETAFDAMEAYRLAIRSGEDDATVDAAANAAHEAISDVKGEAERDTVFGNLELRRDPQSGERIETEADKQCEEIDESHLRAWLEIMDYIDDLRRRARDNPEFALRLRLEAAHVLIFHAPPRVDQLPRNLQPPKDWQ